MIAGKAKIQMGTGDVATCSEFVTLNNGDIAVILYFVSISPQKIGGKVSEKCEAETAPVQFLVTSPESLNVIISACEFMKDAWNKVREGVT